jgi:F-type H+-transporting ATPase subunit b
MKHRISTAAALAIAALMPSPAMAAEEAAGGGSWLRLMFFAINFAIFAYILVRFATPMVRKYFVDRSGEIRGVLSRANAAFQQAQDLANSAAKGLAELDAEKARIAAEFEAETAHQVRMIGELARTAAERIRRDAEMTAAAVADSAQRRVRNHLAALTAQIARDLIARDFQDSDQSRLLGSFMEKLRQEART